jgi:hypothetical protein
MWNMLLSQQLRTWRKRKFQIKSHKFKWDKICHCFKVEVQDNIYGVYDDNNDSDDDNISI